jgi:HEAT repeat protein
VAKKVSRPISFGKAIAALGADGRLDEATLRAFSDLDGERLAMWQDAWRNLTLNRRISLIEALRDLAEEDIEVDFRPLFRSALGDIEERVRLTSVEGLYEDDHPSLIAPLIALLRDDPSETVRAAAAESLGRFAYAGEMDRISDARREQVYAALMRALLTSPDDSLVHRRALESLAYVTNEEIDLQIRDAFNSQNDLLRLSAIVAMGRSNNRAYSELVRSELHSVSPAVRREAAKASGELEDEDATPDLAQLLDDSDQDVRFAALDALAMIGGKDARRLIEESANSDDAAFAEHAAQALEEFDFWHGDLDFPIALFDEDEHKPSKVVKPRSRRS